MRRIAAAFRRRGRVPPVRHQRAMNDDLPKGFGDPQIQRMAADGHLAGLVAARGRLSRRRLGSDAIGDFLARHDRFCAGAPFSGRNADAAGRFTIPFVAVRSTGRCAPMADNAAAIAALAAASITARRAHSGMPRSKADRLAGLIDRDGAREAVALNRRRKAVSRQQFGRGAVAGKLDRAGGLLPIAWQIRGRPAPLRNAVGCLSPGV
jgi:hypothetical protein